MSYCNATEPTFDELITLQQFGGYFSCVGVVLLIPLLLSKLIVPQFRAFPSRLSTLFVSCSLGWNITIVVGLTQDWEQLWVAKLEGRQSTTFCKVQGMLIQFFISTQILLWLEITMGMYLLIIKKKTFTDISKYESYFHSFWIVGGSLMTFVPALIWEPVPQLGASYCWLTEDYDYAIQIGFLHCEMGLALIGGSILISKVLYRLFQISRSVGDDSSTWDIWINFYSVPFLFNTYSTLINFFSISFIFHTFFRYYQTSHSVVRLAPCDVCCFVLLRVCDSGTVCRQSNFEPVQCMVLAPSNGILSFCCCFRIRYYIIYGIEPHGILPGSEGTPGTVLHALYVRGKRSWQRIKSSFGTTTLWKWRCSIVKLKNYIYF